jgi:heat shock protein HslJ
MKKLVALSVVVVAIAIALFVVLNRNDDAVADGSAGAVQPGEEIQRLWVGPQLVDCVGVAPQKCLQIRRSADGEIEWFYDSIDGFTHEAGTSYVLDVAVSTVENPPADASSLRYRLVKVVESTTESATAGLDGTTWTFIGFRDGDLFDAALADAPATITFAEGLASGSTSCNSYSGPYTADGDTLSFGPLASTLMGCEEPRMSQETRFLTVLQSVETAELGFDGTLVLAPPSGLTLVFAPATS